VLRAGGSGEGYSEIEGVFWVEVAGRLLRLDEMLRVTEGSDLLLLKLKSMY
jgi:hypothetical protein